MAGLDDDDKRRRTCPLYTTLMAVFLLVAGTVLLGIGIPELAQGTDRSISMVVLGSLCFIPGSYASWILLGACQRWRNYRYDQLPSYDD
ncbi:hypothetical protein FNF27_04609 [Cafeteria roenbergensis]|uniref:Transmembrane protein 230 n=1 Tax=Cafeteria roenbergensis TaxID=33653 RepID=A0A5A8CLB8_CAFRO|nr:hypothetical protein FNF29_02804 [Cafeteria roenbergensis]KAA0161335.1 hypothetical protein FNF28_05083 [Cafeteria roenbergensis]KAA0163089.1 hypothetical protein FNF31_02912 [Cafeteria roenbergensis]KAA0173852.1 hypothetical protein FNF27_04609 [Cafeteria roenbergensis]|eukprot:KAA0153815.1 hypothetical protein FNF29_02804 [Cafeteria roenbergensis]